MQQQQQRQRRVWTLGPRVRHGSSWMPIRGSRCGCWLSPAGGAPLRKLQLLLLLSLLLPGAWSFLSEEQEELLVELHNHYRGVVSPSASAMLPLKWDPGLKLIAEGYATKCDWSHNPELEDTGENLFAGTGALDLREALEKWFLEHLDYDFNNNSCEEEKMCGHYTQMVWADTHRVGCAFHLCSTMEGLGWERVSFLVCNYFPAGNYEDERPYVEGDWCSRCPEKLLKCENNLCVPEVEEEEEEEEDDATRWETFPPPTEDELPVLQEVPQVEGALVEAVEDALEEAEEETVALPPVTTEVQPDPPTTTTTTPKTTTSIPAGHLVDTPPPATPEPGTPPPPAPPRPPVVRETAQEEGAAQEEVKVEEEKQEEEQKRRIPKLVPNRKQTTSAAAVSSSPSLLLAFLTVMLTLRL